MKDVIRKLLERLDPKVIKAFVTKLLSRFDPKVRALIAGTLFGVIALFGYFVFGTDPESFCDFPGTRELAEVGDVQLCSHGPDPVRAFAAASTDPEIITPVRADRLCPGDGVSGHRIHVWWTVPAGRPEPTTDPTREVLRSLGLAERILQAGHPSIYQKFQFFCADDTKPTVTRLGTSLGSNGQLEFEEVTGALAARGVLDDTNSIQLVFGFNTDAVYSFCGQGTLMPSNAFQPTATELDAPQTSFVSCGQSADTTVHELMHNFGAVHPDAPHSSGAWHCHELADLECYDDGGAYFTDGGRMLRNCPEPAPYFTLDCGRDDYWNPERPAQGYLADHWNASRSPFLTPPRKKS